MSRVVTRQQMKRTRRALVVLASIGDDPWADEDRVVKRAAAKLMGRPAPVFAPYRHVPAILRGTGHDQ